MPDAVRAKAAARQRTRYHKKMADPVLAARERQRWRERDERRQQARADDPAVRDEFNRKRRISDARQRERIRSDPEAVARIRARQRPTQRARTLRSKYGITLEDYRRLLEAQGGGCAICGTVRDGKTLHVDHDHETGKVRGLLCGHCNRGLGLFGDDAERLALASEYLRDRGGA